MYVEAVEEIFASDFFFGPMNLGSFLLKLSVDAQKQFASSPLNNENSEVQLISSLL